MRYPRRAGGFLFAIALTVGAILAGPDVQPARAAFAGPNGSIAFQRADAQGTEVWSMTPNGSGQVKLTDEGQNSNPAWSPDGSKIAFTSDRDGNAEIYVMNADGSAETRLTDNVGYDGGPAWSPDGLKIAFHRFGSTDYDIWVMNANGTSPVNITNNAAEDVFPSWRPGSTRIAFQTNRDGNGEIYAADQTGANLANLTNTPAREDGDPNWSPDGSRIVFDGGGAGVADLWIMNANGTGQTNMTASLAAPNHHATWSPDGFKIAFVSSRDFNDEIYTMNVDGSSQRRLTNNAPPGNTYPEDWFPDWRPAALDPVVCDLAVAVAGGLPQDDALPLSIGQEFYVSGAGYPVGATVNLVFDYLATPESFSESVAADGQGAFALGYYFTPGSEGAWTVAASVPVASVCRDLVHLDVVTGHPFTDIAGHRFEPEIAWLYQRGITGGCASTRFCPNASVTREQMAAFLDRALALPATSQDFFTDDETSSLEPSINRLAAAGITGGCAPGRFCPKALVTREQMASFLVRAFGLGPTSTDFFIDDETSSHETNINRLAASGITGGCATNRYCPTAVVTRGQMAAFLERALFSMVPASAASTSSSADISGAGAGRPRQPQRGLVDSTPGGQ
jgi:Tol biopolymer transport system component